MSWTQACCERCWWERYPGRSPTVARDSELESCCYCGETTLDGIYVRDDPQVVPFPRKEVPEGVTLETMRTQRGAPYLWVSVDCGDDRSSLRAMRSRYEAIEWALEQQRLNP